MRVLGGDTAAAHPQRAARRRARGDLQRDRRLERRHAQRGAERRLGERDRHGQREVVAGAAEQRVRAHVHGDEQVAGRAAAGARRALAGDAQLAHRRGRPAGTRTVIVRVCVVVPVPPHSGHGSSTIWPVPRQSRHGSLTPKPPWLNEHRRPEPPQVGQVRGDVPGRAPLPPQVVQVAGPGQLQRQGRAAHRLVEVQRHLGADVLPAGRAAARAAAPTPPAPPPPNRLPNRSPRFAPPDAAEQVGHVEASSRR